MNNKTKVVICLVLMCASIPVYAAGADKLESLAILGEHVRAAALVAEEVTDTPVTVEEMITTEAEAAGIDEHLALAIARLETGHFTSDAYLTGNNVGGLSDNEVPRSYATLEDGVAAYIECLKTYYAAGLTTPELIGERWCPVNEKWVDIVKDIMQEVTL